MAHGMAGAGVVSWRGATLIDVFIHLVPVLGYRYKHSREGNDTRAGTKLGCTTLTPVARQRASRHVPGGGCAPLMQADLDAGAVMIAG